MPDNTHKSLLNSQSWRNMSQSIATSVCNISNTAYSRLHLNAIAKRVLPEHTRDALFQLFCDVRTNTPKDQVFFVRHAEALKPHTFTGWLAMLAALLYSTAGLALTAVGALGLMATVAFSSIFVAVAGGVMFAMFVGTVATTLTFASLGLVAVASGAGTTAAAGYVTFNFWKLVFEKLGVVRQRAHVTGYPQGQQALPSSDQGAHSSHGHSATQSTFGSPTKSPGFNPLSDGAPGENTRQPTHNKLTTEPAKDPFRKDIGIPDDDINDIYARGGSSASSAGTDHSDVPGSAFGSAISQGESPFKSSSSTSSGSSTVTTGAPAYAPRQGTNDTDINDIFGKGGSHGSQGAKFSASDAQTFGGSNTSSKQSGTQTGGQAGGQTGGQAGGGQAGKASGAQAGKASGGQAGKASGGQAGKASGGQSQAGSGKHSGEQSSGMSGGHLAAKDTSKSASSGSTGTNPGQATNDTDINDVFSKGGSQGSSADHKAPSGAPSRGSEPRDTGRATNARSAGSNATNDADINDVHGKGGSHGGPSHGGQTRSKGPPRSSDNSFGGFGAEDIGLQSNFRGPSGQQGPCGSSGPRGSTTMHDSNFVGGGGHNAY